MISLNLKTMQTVVNRKGEKCYISASRRIPEVGKVFNYRIVDNIVIIIKMKSR